MVKMLLFNNINNWEKNYYFQKFTLKLKIVKNLKLKL